jgi:hypothetical protein
MLPEKVPNAAFSRSGVTEKVAIGKGVDKWHITESIITGTIAGILLGFPGAW